MSAERIPGDLRRFSRACARVTQIGTLAGAAVLYGMLGATAALGLLLGGVAGMLRFQLRYAAIVRGPSVPSLVQARLLGYALSAGALALGFAFPTVASPWSTAAGLLAMNVSVVAVALLDRGPRSGACTGAAS